MSSAKQPPAAPPVKTGGGDNNNRNLMTGLMDETPQRVVKVRRDFVTAEEFSFNAASLVGSWFHRLESDRIVWKGVVVAEPQMGTYLVEIDKLDIGAEKVQRLIDLDRMLNDDDGYDWRFYDSEEAANVAYANWVRTEHERVT